MMSDAKEEPAEPQKPQSGSQKSRFKGLDVGRKRGRRASRDNVITAAEGRPNIEYSSGQELAQPLSVHWDGPSHRSCSDDYAAPEDRLAVVMRRSDRFASAMDPPGRYQGEVARAEEWRSGMDAVDELRSGIPSTTAGEFSIHVLEAPSLVLGSSEYCPGTNQEGILDLDIRSDLSNALEKTSIRRRSSVLDPRLFGSQEIGGLGKVEIAEENSASIPEVDEAVGDAIQLSEISRLQGTSKTPSSPVIPSKEESKLKTSAPEMTENEATQSCFEVSRAAKMREAPHKIKPEKDSKRKFRWIKKLF